MEFLICYLMHTPKREQNCRPSYRLPNNGLFALHSCCAFRFLFWLFTHHIFQHPMCSLIVQIFLKFPLLVQILLSIFKVKMWQKAISTFSNLWLLKLQLLLNPLFSSIIMWWTLLVLNRRILYILSVFFIGR